MKPQSRELILKLDSNLDDIIKVYRHLLNVVRKEKEILIAADLDELNTNNKSKETMLLKARSLEETRQSIVKELALSEGLSEDIRLKDLALHFGGAEGERFQKVHAVLNLLITRVREHNQHNEQLVNSALDTVTGGMQSIRESVGAKRNYKKGGKLNEAQPGSGRLVSKEA